MCGGGTLGQQRRRVRPEAEDANQTFCRAGPPALGKPAELVGLGEIILGSSTTKSPLSSASSSLKNHF